jgi:hypothetical protein
VNHKENLNNDLNTSITKAPNSFVTAKGSMPLPYKITKLASTKSKADNHDESNAINFLKTFHISNKDIIKRKNDKESDRPKQKQKVTTNDEDYTPPGTQWDENNYSCAYDVLFTILFNLWSANPKKWKKKNSKSQINIFLH